MILNSMLDNSAGFLFALSFVVLAAYGVTRAVQALVDCGRGWLGRLR